MFRCEAGICQQIHDFAGGAAGRVRRGPCAAGLRRGHRPRHGSLLGLSIPGTVHQLLS